VAIILSVIIIVLCTAPISASAKESDKSIYRYALTALKNVNGQDAAKQALIGALGRPDLSNKNKAKIYYFHNTFYRAFHFKTSIILTVVSNYLY